MVKKGGRKQRLSRGGLALFLSLYPALSALHLFDHSHNHAWCDAHGHVVHIDPNAAPVGDPNTEIASFWNYFFTGKDSSECGILQGMREKSLCPKKVCLHRPLSFIQSYENSEILFFKDILILAPKHDPPENSFSFS